MNRFKSKQVVYPSIFQQYKEHFCFHPVVMYTGKKVNLYDSIPELIFGAVTRELHTLQLHPGTSVCTFYTYISTLPTFLENLVKILLHQNQQIYILLTILQEPRTNKWQGWISNIDVTLQHVKQQLLSTYHCVIHIMGVPCEFLNTQNFKTQLIKINKYNRGMLNEFWQQYSLEQGLFSMNMNTWV